jgi:prepilin signal peptidase PulO-like enzyme (type II secretory pathway)
VAPLLFFLAGIPAAFAADYAIRKLSRRARREDVADDAAAERSLPWHHGRWPARIRVALVCSLPPLMAIAGARFDPLPAVVVSGLLGAFVVCTGTDLLDFRVPNVITYPSTVLALAAALLLPGGDVVTSVIAALLGGGIFLLLAVLTRGGMGLGDVKLAVLIGAALGFPAGYQALMAGVFAGGITIGLLFVLGVVGRRQPVPYAPFLAIAAAAFLLTGGAGFAPL